MTRYWIIRLSAVLALLALASHPALGLRLNDAAGPMNGTESSVIQLWVERLLALRGEDAWLAMGLLFIATLFGITHWFVLRAAPDKPLSGIRRLMLASMLRLVGVSAFLLIQLLTDYNAVPRVKTGIIPVCLYGLFFVSLLVFELFQKGANLRPDSDGK